jgi:hypothetical protein
MIKTSALHLPSAAKQARQAQSWAHQLLDGMILEYEQRGEGMLPFAPMSDGMPIILPRGKAIRFSQEVNLAIKQRNAAELAREESRRDAQIEEARRSKSGTVHTPDYVPQMTYWRVRAIQMQDYGVDMYQLIIDNPQPPRNRKMSELAELAARFFAEKVKDTPHDMTQVVPKHDPYEAFLRDGMPTTEGDVK